MRMIVDAFKDTLELGLEKPKQVVVRFPSTLVLVPPNPDQNGVGVGDTTVESLPPMRPLRAPLFPPFAGCMTKRVAPCDGPGWASYRRTPGSTTSYPSKWHSHVTLTHAM
jgi:hypothetical protein